MSSSVVFSSKYGPVLVILRYLTRVEQIEVQFTSKGFFESSEIVFKEYDTSKPLYWCPASGRYLHFWNSLWTSFVKRAEENFDSLSNSSLLISGMKRFFKARDEVCRFEFPVNYLFRLLSHGVTFSKNSGIKYLSDRLFMKYPQGNEKKEAILKYNRFLLNSLLCHRREENIDHLTDGTGIFSTLFVNETSESFKVFIYVHASAISEASTNSSSTWGVEMLPGSEKIVLTEKPFYGDLLSFSSEPGKRPRLSCERARVEITGIPDTPTRGVRMKFPNRYFKNTIFVDIPDLVVRVEEKDWGDDRSGRLVDQRYAIKTFKRCEGGLKSVDNEPDYGYFGLF